MLKARKGWQKNVQEKANGEEGITMLLCVDWYIFTGVSEELRTYVLRVIYNTAVKNSNLAIWKVVGAWKLSDERKLINDVRKKLSWNIKYFIVQQIHSII